MMYNEIISNIRTINHETNIICVSVQEFFDKLLLSPLGSHYVCTEPHTCQFDLGSSIVIESKNADHYGAKEYIKFCALPEGLATIDYLWESPDSKEEFSKTINFSPNDDPSMVAARVILACKYIPDGDFSLSIIHFLSEEIENNNDNYHNYPIPNI